MRRVGGVVAACLSAAAGLLFAAPAPADELLPAVELLPEKHIDRFLLFSGFDLWRTGGSAYGGLLWSPKGLVREGFTLKLLTAAGLYRYQANLTPTDGAYVLTSAMPGWRFMGDRLELTIFLGPDFQYHQFSPDDLHNRVRGPNWGARLGGDLWYQPSDHLMATGSLSVSTIGPNFWSRAAVGWRLFDSVWIGPEAMALGGNTYQQFRAGIHATALRTGAFEWSAGVGYAHDSDDRDGAYVHLDILTRR